jgi:hypothetical protein
MRTWPRAQEKRVPIAMRSSSELATKMAMSTRLNKTRSLFSVDSIVAVAVVVVEGRGEGNCAGVAGAGAVKRFLDVEQISVVSARE